MFDILIWVVGFIVISLGFVVFFGAPYVPTLKKQIDDAMKIYDFSDKDIFVDIGSGDGVLLRAAAHRGARAIGYELNPWLWMVSKLLSRRNKKITTHLANFWRVDLPRDATVVYTFLNGKYMGRLEKKLQAHVNSTGSPLYFISFGFKMTDRKIINHQGPMLLYRFDPLQT